MYHIVYYINGEGVTDGTLFHSLNDAKHAASAWMENQPESIWCEIEVTTVVNVIVNKNGRIHISGE